MQLDSFYDLELSINIQFYKIFERKTLPFRGGMNLSTKINIFNKNKKQQKMTIFEFNDIFIYRNYKVVSYK